MYNIMIVEDDEGIASGIKTQLESWGFSADCAEDFRDIIPEFLSLSPHLILLDISLPYFNGYHWCSEIRKISKVPIIFISSASDNMNVVMAMNMGGDDFIAKPFEPTVLIAKVQAMLRRTYDFGKQTTTIEHDGVLLHLTNATITYQGEQLELTKNEYRIMLTLMENIGKIVSREDLMQALWDTDSFVDENTLTVNINRLRKKLEKMDLTDFIKTKVGMGYIIG